MTDDQSAKLTRFAVFTVVILFLVGGIREGLHIKGVIGYSLRNENTELAKSIETCEEFFGDRRVQSEEAYPPVPDIVPKGQSVCQTWAKVGQQISDDFSIWHTALWVVGALIGAATLLVAFLCFAGRPVQVRG